MVESLREIAPGLWVSDIESAGLLGEDFALVVDCTGKGPRERNRVQARPSGSTSHAWTVEDLDRIVGLVRPHLAGGSPVLIHCRRGVSRSVCAAAAVLIAMGACTTVDGALIRAKFRGETPSTHSVSGLRKWFKARNERRQGTLFPAAK